jgi:hypothetical protein
MKTANKLSSSLILTAAAAAALCAVAFAWQTELTHKNNVTLQTSQTVTISAKRLSAEEKRSFDQNGSGTATQTVMISAKRMTAEEKLAMDKNNAHSVPANTQFTQVKKPVRKIA